MQHIVQRRLEGIRQDIAELSEREREKRAVLGNERYEREVEGLLVVEKVLTAMLEEHRREVRAQVGNDVAPPMRVAVEGWVMGPLTGFSVDAADTGVVLELRVAAQWPEVEELTSMIACRRRALGHVTKG